MQDLDPTRYGEADAGGRRRAERLLVREKHCRSWLSKIICGVIFYETLGKADAPGGAPALTPHPRRPYVRTFVCPSRARLSVRHLVLRGRS
jgi:hypothetical protein